MAPNPVYSPYAAVRGHMESLGGPYTVKQLPRKEKGIETTVRQTLNSVKPRSQDPGLSKGMEFIFGLIYTTED